MRLTVVLCIAAVMSLAGCGEKPQGVKAATKKADGKPWDATASSSLAPGWKGGDQAAWEEQIRARAQSQNEYLRSTKSAP